MGYHINLERHRLSPGITAHEWRDFVLGRPELELADEDDGFITAILHGNDNLALHYSKGSASVFTKNPDGPRIIEYMASIAPYFDTVVTGDEGERYSTEADWGTQNDWTKPPKVERKPFWLRKLSPSKRVIAGFHLGCCSSSLENSSFLLDEAAQTRYGADKAREVIRFSRAAIRRIPEFSITTGRIPPFDVSPE